MPRMTIDLPKDVLDKLAIVVQHQSWWPTTPEPFNIEALIGTVVTAYAREQVSDNGKLNPDLRTEGSVFIRLTNAVLVTAIDFGILDFHLPPDADSPSDKLLDAMYSAEMRPAVHLRTNQIIQRLAIMATLKTGTIPVVHGESHYDIFVEFDKTSDNQHRARVKITQPGSAE